MSTAKANSLSLGKGSSSDSNYTFYVSSDELRLGTGMPGDISVDLLTMKQSGDVIFNVPMKGFSDETLYNPSDFVEIAPGEATTGGGRYAVFLSSDGKKLGSVSLAGMVRSSSGWNNSANEIVTLGWLGGDYQMPAANGSGSTLGTLGSMPPGAVLMWSQGSIPSGWLICDGTSGTPDLRDRFVVHSGSDYAVGDTGGSVSVTLGTTELPTHRHTITGTTASASLSHSHNISITVANVSEGSHTHTYEDYYIAGIGTLTLRSSTSGTSKAVRLSPTIIYGDTSFATNDSHSHTVSTPSDTVYHNHGFPGKTSSQTGGGNAHENRPPYYSLYYIMKAS